MPRLPLILPALLVSFLLLGCGEQPAPSEPAITPEPSLRPASILDTVPSPDGHRTFVLRSESIIAFAFIPDDESMTVLTGLTLEQLDVLCSGGEPIFEPASVQALSSPRLSRVVVKARDFNVLVFEGFFDICGVPPLAVGEGSYTETGGLVFNGSAVATARFTFQAWVVEPNGEPHHILIRQHLQFHQKTGEFRLLVNEFTFK